jgi:hypothetical protein
LDRSTSLVHGPKGAQTAGQWPVGARRALPVEGDLYALDAALALGNHGIHANPGVTALKFTSFAAPPTQPGGGYVGLELVVGSDEAVPGGLGWVALRPQGSHPSSRKHLRLGGHQQGEVQDLQGRRFLVESDLPKEYLRGTPKTVSLQGTNAAAYLLLGAQAMHGVWSEQAAGWAVPLAGDYRLSAQFTLEHLSGGGPSVASVRWHVDGAPPTGPAVEQKVWVQGERPSPLTLTTRLALDAGQIVGVHLQMETGAARVLSGLGQILIERVL